MNPNPSTTTRSRYLFPILLMTGAVLVLGACGSTSSDHASGSTSPAAQSVATPAPAPASATATPKTNATQPPAQPARETASTDDGIPIYQPSHVVTSGHSYTGLKSSDSVSKVSDWYNHALVQSGWDFTSKSLNRWSGNFVVRKDGQGASVSVSHGFGDTLIAISRYPV
jgi:hypothetical protein